MEEKIELHAVFHGRVQGVFFRATVQKYARERGIVGFIENLTDGSVKMVVQGTKPDLEQLIENINKHPGPAEIARVDLNYTKISSPYQGFSIKH